MNLAIDVETSTKPRHLPWLPNSYLSLVSVCTSDGDVKSWVFNHQESEGVPREHIEDIQSYIDRAKRIVGHNIKFDLHWLHHIGLDFTDKALYCTLVAEYILRSQQKLDGLSLAALSQYYGLPSKIDRVKLLWDSGYETDEIPLNILIPYCEQDTINALSIYNRQVPQIKSCRKFPLISLEMEALRMIQQAEYNGMLLDCELLQKYNEEYTQQIQDIDEELTQTLGIPNLNSPDQLSAALFGGTFKEPCEETVTRELKNGTIKEYTRKGTQEVYLDGVGFEPLPNTELKKAGVYSTSIVVLQQLKGKNKQQKRIIELLTERSRLEQLRSTYFEGLQGRVGDDGYVHPSINQTVTVTSRLSCSSPNLQNQPRGNTGPVKETFITRF